MSKQEINENAEKFIDELGLAGNARDVKPEECTCGEAGCRQHESWAKRVIDKIFEGWAPDSDGLDWISSKFKESSE